MQSTADETVSAIIRKWSAGFSKLHAAALASLYSTNAFFFGSNPTLYRGQEGVAAYFNALPFACRSIHRSANRAGQPRSDQFCRHGEF
jgi:ketosteroid isomerase-like protein